ncbi:MAG: heme exporter protein CcmB [Bacteroidetes bacterium]|nr:heme exporter protein CcmB [Bacteroidota bacterium]
MMQEKPDGAIRRFVYESNTLKEYSRRYMNTLATIWAVAVKELRSELRVRYSLNTLLLFVVTLLAIIAFALQDSSPDPEILSALFWVAVTFAALEGLSRVFVREEERGTAMILQLAASSSAVYFGKLIFNSCLALVLSMTITLMYHVVFPVFIIQSSAIFSLTVFLGSLGLASASTITAAIIAKAQAKNTLYTVLAFPVLVPLLMTVIQSTGLSIRGAEWAEAIPYFQIMIGYLFVVIGFSFLLFDFIWKD